MREYRTWQEILLERLAADEKRAIGYLDVALEEYQEDGDTPFFFLGLQNVIEARGGVAEVAKQAGIKAECLSDMLASDEAPRLDTLSVILTALGCRLSIQPLETRQPEVEHSAEAVTTVPLENARPHLEVTTERGDLR